MVDINFGQHVGIDFETSEFEKSLTDLILKGE